MASKIDYDALRAQTLGAGSDEAVTVNTRALIDKVLARYSGEWTTLRELLQNAADASSKNVKITLETLPSSTVPVPQSGNSSTRLRHVLLHHTMKSTKVENDGDVFQATDWARLKKIAEGNPDETKIGAFGVGFYSVFSECEEPFVSSGKEALAFYWKGDALFTKSLPLPNGQVSDTTFMLPNRNKDSPVPNLLSLCRFLASSLTFVGLDRVELWLDEWKVMVLKKKSAPSLDVQIPKEVNRKTKEGLMHVANVTRDAAQLDAQWLKAVEWNPKTSTQPVSDNSAGKGVQPSQSLRSFFHRLAPGVSNTAAVERLAKEEREAQLQISEDLVGESSGTIFVHVDKATVRTQVNRSFTSELERATKKAPPKSTTISLLSASYDESVASSSALSVSSGQASGASKIFDSFLPVNGKGRIFIGFTTNQTTGVNVHISTPSIIPTVERESIDLNNRFVRTWNTELLRVAGIIGRISWGSEMTTLQEKLARHVQSVNKKNVGKEDITSVLPEALFLHNAYDWSETTPSSEVGTLIEEAFWTCNQKVSITTLSTQGVLPASQVRLEPESLEFIEGIPFLPVGLAGVGLIKKLIDYGVITEITVSDIKSALESKALSTAQLKQFLAWVLHKVHINEIDTSMGRTLLNAVVANDDQNGTSKLIVLGDMKGFLNPNRIPAEMPLPPYVLPFKFTKDIGRAALELFFEDLQMVPWLRWLVENTGGRGDLSLEHDITHSPTFAATVLPVISKQWEGLSQSSKATVIDLLSQRTIMPTKMGMKKPAEAYFPTVKLFDDLPIVVGLHAVKDKFLSAMGVRKTIEIGVVFDRLMNTTDTKSAIPKSAPKWSHVDLIRYLASVRQDIPAADIKRLRDAKICPAETLQPSNERYLISELYQPEESLRQLKLPILYWPAEYRSESAEGRFLMFLGLRTHPSYQDLLHIVSNAMSNGEFRLRDRALKYFIDHHQTKGYATFDHASVTLAYLPIQGNEKKVAAPKDVFINERATILGFDILRRDLQIHALKFGVKQDPSIAMCIERLIKNPPQSKRAAREVFGYMAGRVADLTSHHAESLSSAKIVPVMMKTGTRVDAKTEKVGESISHIPPRICFLGYGDFKYADIFDYVDFGQEANSFLLRIGSKHEPSIGELAGRLVREPAGLFSILGDARYLELLRSVADSWATLKKDKALVKDMRASKCLLAYKEISVKQPHEDEEEDEESAVKSWELAKASEVVVVDDIITFRLFKEALLAAPMEESLEAFYHNLGAREVGSLLEERQSLGPSEQDQRPALRLERLLHERVRLFLHDYRAEAVKHDHNWVQKHLSVKCVKSISLTLSLQGYNLRRRQSKQAVLFSEQPILYVMSNFDMLGVSQAMAPLLLNRVKPQSILMLEMMLESSLNKLGRRGYNVQRIMNQKLREANIADERRAQQESEERQKIKESEAAWLKAEAESAAKANEQHPMPGLFPDSPDRHSRANANAPEEDLQPARRPRGFLSGLGKQFGFDQVKRSITPNAISPTNNTRPPQQAHEDSPPPPYSQEDSQTQRPAPQPETVTAPHQVQQNLLNLIQASRPHHSSSLQSNTTYNDVKETSTYCDAKPAHSLISIGEALGVRIFLDKDTEAKGVTSGKFLAENTSALHLFASVLHECADSFALKRNAVHIFYDDSGSTIAFNSNRALFFNYRYFENLHLPIAQQGKKAEAFTYWAVTMAHELAHNMVSDHSSQHSYYTESLIIKYFGKISTRLGPSDGTRANPLIDPLRQDSAAGRLLPDIE